jgi:hypothetical protein
MKRTIIFLTMCTLLTAFVACDPGVAEMPDPGRDGNVFDLGSVDKFIDFTTVGKPYYYDSNGVRFPLNQYGMLTTFFKNGGYVAPENPAILHVCEAPNYSAQALVDYNFATDYTVRFRLTDSTRVYADGKKSTSPVQQNEPQGFIMAQIFLAGTNPHGAVMVLIFPSNSFPVEIPNVGIWPVYKSLYPNLHENVFVVLNYDGKGAGSLVACANVPGIKAVDPAADPVIQTFTLRPCVSGMMPRKNTDLLFL